MVVEKLNLVNSARCLVKTSMNSLLLLCLTSFLLLYSTM
jgi:hypothetical protein